MSKVFATLGMSLDGFIAGPNARPGNPLGDGGTRIHEWVYGVETWRARQNAEGGQIDQDDDIVRENFARAGAYIMGRHMFAEGEVGWPDPPPFRAPVFVLTHTPRAPWVRQGGTTFTFVTEGIDTALDQARKAAGDKDVQISGGADTVRQFLNAGLVDELQIHLAPIVFGAGVRLFDGVSPDLGLVPAQAVGSPQVTHLTYQITSSWARTGQSSTTQDHEHRKGSST